MSDPARAMSREDALAELLALQDAGVILLEGHPTARSVDLDGWDGTAPQDGNVAGVVIRYWESGTATVGEPSGPAAPDRLDPRNALALVRLCQWLSATYNVTELYHIGISGGGVDQHGNPRIDCHGQGRAVDLMGVRATAEDGDEWVLTVHDDWGSVATALTPGGTWPEGTGTATSYRLDDVDADPFVRQFFRDLYDVVATEWQDRSSGPDGLDVTTAIGEGGFVMHPDHPTSAPGTRNGREAHHNHLHMQIGRTGTEH